MISYLGFADPFSSFSHLGAAGAVGVGTYLLLKRGRGNGARVTSLLIYSFSLIFLFSMSGVYHLLSRDTVAREVLQRLDYAGIWVLIAGSFTPIHMILFRGAWRWAILLVVWVIAITGLVLQVVFFSEFPHWLSVSLFLGLGWMGILTAYRFKSVFENHSLRPLAVGGISYSVGAIIDAVNWPTLWAGVFEPHEIFHVFVMLGAYFHWRFIYEWADHPVHNDLLFHVAVNDGKYTAQALGESIVVEAMSVEELKISIRTKVDQKYREAIRPVVRLQYFREEHLTSSDDNG